jgi:ATP-binding cassette subfamily B protein
MAIWSMDEGLRKITKSIADAGEMVDIFEHPIELSESEDTVHTLQNASVTLENISFSYGGTKQVFNDLSLAIPAGQKVGICGTTGSGKSTLANLILRTMDPTEGSITVDTYSIKNDFSQDGLKKHISYVSQHIDIFNRSIMENIRFANHLATDEEVISAAKRAQIHGFIAGLPDKYETTVGEQGHRLSGGQRQRIGIARALLRNTPILILDEATAALDVMTEGEILDVLNQEFVGKTVVVIAHRLSTIRNLDRILVLEEGKIVEDGNHYQLMDLQGSYFEFIKRQNAERGPTEDFERPHFAH